VNQSTAFLPRGKVSRDLFKHQAGVLLGPDTGKADVPELHDGHTILPVHDLAWEIGEDELCNAAGHPSVAIVKAGLRCKVDCDFSHVEAPS
jgi:hypothetical protein